MRREAPEKPEWLVLVEGELGVRKGADASAVNSPRVVQLFADAGFSGIKQDSVVWRAAVVGAMLKGRTTMLTILCWVCTEVRQP